MGKITGFARVNDGQWLMRWHAVEGLPLAIDELELALEGDVIVITVSHRGNALLKLACPVPKEDHDDQADDEAGAAPVGAPQAGSSED